MRHDFDIDNAAADAALIEEIPTLIDEFLSGQLDLSICQRRQAQLSVVVDIYGVV
jgi:hypothetical protein